MSMSESESKLNPTRSKSDLARLLETRKRIKLKTPTFRRFESWRYVRIDEPWRKPKGIDNHMRLSVKGWPHLVKIGYGVPMEVRYLHPSGLKDVLVHNLSELELLSPETDAARIAAGVGRRKRIEIAKRAKSLGIRVLNGKNLLLGVKKEPAEETASDKKAKKKKDSKN